MKFDDYHRTVIGYHGTRRDIALDIVQRTRDFKPSQNQDDWLGHGIYFWEYAPQQAYWWAEKRKERERWNEPIAVVASMIRLGFCFDLLDPYNVNYLKDAHDAYLDACNIDGEPIPQNVNQSKFLDCAVFQFAYAVIEKSARKPVDTSRAVYVPTGKDKRIWPRSWISHGAHIQICVRNSGCILGTWLHGTDDVEE